MLDRFEQRFVDRQNLDRVLLTVVSLTLRILIAVFITQPGYMDAAYYAAGAVSIARGSGLNEPFIWNYLNDPVGMPHPGFLYWMPLPSLLGAPMAAMFPNSFFALQVPFVILSTLVPLMAYGLAKEVTGSRWLAWASGLLAVFGGFFFPYWTLPETFAPFALFGALALWLAGGSREENGWRMEKGRWLLAGALVGLAHLTRADGILLLPIVAVAPFLSYEPDDPPIAENPASYASRFTFYVSRFTRQASWVAFRQSLFILLGYLLAMAPWLARNVAVIGAPLSPAGTKTIWLTEYDDLFCYDCDLSPASYLAWGWGNILRSKLSALWINFQRLLAEGGMVFLLPLVIIGFYRLRRGLAFLLAFLYLVLIYLAHSLIFTFPGWRGGFFHASSAVLPFLYAAGIEGLDRVIRWVARRRRTWRYRQARTVFAVAVVVIAVILSGTRAWRQITSWRRAGTIYQDVERWLTGRAADDAGVMVRNPPAFWYHTDRPAIVIPNGGVDMLIEVADRYDVRYVLLDSSHPAPLADLHAGEVSHPRLVVLERWPEERAVLYAVEP